MADQENFKELRLANTYLKVIFGIIITTVIIPFLLYNHLTNEKRI